MKKNNIIFLVCAFWCMVFVTACEDDLTRQANYSAYEFESVDADGGNWNPVLLASPAQITIPDPEEVTSPEYLAELSSMKSSMASLSCDQRGAVA